MRRNKKEKGALWEQNPKALLFLWGNAGQAVFCIKYMV
jgi:hypothetical protein